MNEQSWQFLILLLVSCASFAAGYLYHKAQVLLGWARAPICNVHIRLDETTIARLIGDRMQTVQTRNFRSRVN